MPRFPTDLSDDEEHPSRPSAGRKPVDASGYSSDKNVGWSEQQVKDAREEWSEAAADELGAKEYRQARKVTILLSTGFVAEKVLGPSNLINRVPRTGETTAYKELIPKVSESVGGDANLATLLEAGLMRMPEFELMLEHVPAAARDEVQFVLVLMINEVVGRSTANLVEIMAILQKTMKDKTPGALLQRMLERCLFTPTGGSKLSKIGRNKMSVEKLSTALQKLFAGNSELYFSLAQHLGAKDPSQLVAKFQPMYEAFADNILTHVRFETE
jgi:hypothetical protein